MLANYARPPGPSNRGERSQLIYDKRPIYEQALEIKDRKKLRYRNEKLKDLRSLLQSSNNIEVEEVF